LTTKQFIEMWGNDQTGDLASARLMGIIDGFMASNSMLFLSKMPKMFCLTQKDRLSPGEVFRLIEKASEGNEHILESYLAISVLSVLQKEYPCKH